MASEDLTNPFRQDKSYWATVVVPVSSTAEGRLGEHGNDVNELDRVGGRCPNPNTVMDIVEQSI